MAFGTMTSLGKHQRREVDHRCFQIYEEIHGGSVSLDITATLICKPKSKSMWWKTSLQDKNIEDAC